VRRLVPLLLLALLTLGTALGAALGTVNGPAQTQTSPTKWVANVLAATAHARSARLTFRQVTTSSNHDLREHLDGSGQVDFASGNVRTTEIQHSVQFSSNRPGTPEQASAVTNRIEEIGIGKVEYQALSIGVEGRQWIKMGIPRDPKADLGLTYSDASAPLDALTGFQRIVAVTNDGSATVEGTPTTRYLVTTAPLCAAPKSAHPGATFDQLPTTLWIDGKGRLVQARTVEKTDVRKNPFPNDPSDFSQHFLGRSSQTATVRFSAFGAPVHIEAPPTADVHSTSGFGTISASCTAKTHK
jgi:hypothetical protein